MPPILISFSSGIVNDQCSIFCGMANDCFGKADVGEARSITYQGV